LTHQQKSSKQRIRFCVTTYCGLYHLHHLHHLAPFWRSAQRHLPKLIKAVYHCSPYGSEDTVG